VSLPNAVIDAMLAAGCTADQLAAAMKAANGDAEARREAKREGNAERQKRFRDRRRDGKKPSNDSNALRDVTPPIEELHTPTQSSPSGEACIPKPRQSTAMHLLPQGWEPLLTPAAQRTVDGWPPGKLGREVAAFRDHAADKGRKSRDWQAAFRKWIENADKWMGGNERSNQQIRASGGPSPDRRSSLARAIDEGLDWIGGSAQAGFS
jgi:hypothetical protein